MVQLHIPFYSHNLLSHIHLITQHVLHHHSSRSRPLGSISYPHTISHHLLIHRKWHSNLPRLLDTCRSDNDCHIHSSSLHNDPHTSSCGPNAYIHRHSTRSRNRVDRRRNTSVHSSGSAIRGARLHSPSGDTWLYCISADTRKRIDPRGHIHSFPSPHRRCNTSRSVNCSS